MDLLCNQALQLLHVSDYLAVKMDCIYLRHGSTACKLKSKAAITNLHQLRNILTFKDKSFVPPQALFPFKPWKEAGFVRSLLFQ